METPEPDLFVECRHFADDGQTPNHPVLPLVIMRKTGAARATGPAAWLEQKFLAHGWGATWRWGVYRYHHFHSTNHEVLGVSRGKATLMFGGANGEEVEVIPGDVVILPAGVGHKCLESSADFEVVGAYPRSIKPDLIRSGEGDLPAARLRIAELPLPEQDPVYGTSGPLCRLWSP